jgi:hypothetical protein
MPAGQAIQTLRQAMMGNPAVNVLVAAEPEEEVVIQRLNLSADLAEEFGSVARDAIADENVILTPYEPGYKPETHELLYVDLAEHAELAGQIREFSQVQQAELFHEDAEIVNHLRFYGIVANIKAQRRAVFFRTYSPKKELTRQAGFAVFLGPGHYNRVDTRIFLFDRKIDCFAWRGYLFIRNVPAFERIFGYFEEVRAKADETVTAILTQIPIANAEEFRAACTQQVQMMAKLAQIARKPYLATVSMDDIRRTIEEFELEVEIVRQNGKERIVFEANPSTRWLILKLLDDDFLGSIMTQQKYAVNSKSAI